MPCSCGNATCPCGIPCYCVEESCECHVCAIALHRSCKICSKPLITDVQTDKDSCSCFVGESTPSMLENRDNPHCRMGNIPMPVGYFVSMFPAPAMHFPQFILQQPISLMPLPPSIHTNYRNNLPPLTSDMDVVTPLSAREDFGIPSTSQSSGQSSYQASSGICSTGEQNRTEISREEACPSTDLQSTDERKTANLMQSTKSAAEDHAIVHGPSSFYLPSTRIGNISYPVALADPAWILPNPAFSIAGRPDSSLNLCNPFYAAGPFHSIQAMSNFDQECRQPDSGLNSDSDDLSLAGSVTEQSLDPTKIRQSNLEIRDERLRIEASLSNATGNELAVFPSLGNSNGSNLTEQCKQPAVHSLRSNEISDNYLINDETVASVSSIGMQELSAIACPVSTSANGRNDCLQVCSVDCSVPKSISTDAMWQNTNFLSPHQISSPTQNIPEYFGAPNIGSNLQSMFNNFSAHSSEEEYTNIGNSRFFFNDKRNEDIDSIPLYIDTCTTQKMEKLLKPVKYSGNSSRSFANVASM